MPEDKVSISKSDLIELIKEIRKPVLSDEQVADKRQKEEDRKSLGETMAQGERNRVQEQKNCAHLRSNGSTPAVYIANLNRLYCQHCAGWIAGQPFEGAKPHEVNPDLFNKLYQISVSIE